MSKVTRSFSVDAEAFAALASSAQKAGVSVNYALNLLIKKTFGLQTTEEIFSGVMREPEKPRPIRGNIGAVSNIVQPIPEQKVKEVLSPEMEDDDDEVENIPADFMEEGVVPDIDVKIGTPTENETRTVSGRRVINPFRK